MVFVLDASNSMWGQIEGTTKMNIAKGVLRVFVQEMPAEAKPGLMVYGHRSRDDCADVELVVPPGSGDRGQIVSAVQRLSPTGKTPIAYPLREAWGALAGREEMNNAVVLISDGIGTCDADPCAVAGEFAQRGVDLRIHTVGFDVDADAAAQRECIAEPPGPLGSTPSRPCSRR